MEVVFEFEPNLLICSLVPANISTDMSKSIQPRVSERRSPAVGHHLHPQFHLTVLGSKDLPGPFNEKGLQNLRQEARSGSAGPLSGATEDRTKALVVLEGSEGNASLYTPPFLFAVPGGARGVGPHLLKIWLEV